ncbi:MAG: 4Fe-4S binding protein [Chloroflexota bacterium]
MRDQTRPNNFADEIVLAAGGESMRACYSCGTCVSRCIVPWRDPAYNPRRVFHTVGLGMREAVYEDMTIWHCTACDLCVAGCPQEVRISDVIGALRESALAAGYESPLETVVVDAVLCSGCGTCVDLCPYEALSLAPRETARVSTVDHDRCMGCGCCVAVCPNNAIGGGSFTDRPILETMIEGLQGRAQAGNGRYGV